MFTLSIGRRKPADDAQDTTAVLVGLLKQTTDERDRLLAIAERQLKELERRGLIIAEQDRHHQELHREVEMLRDEYEELCASSASALRTAAAEVADKDEIIVVLRKWLAENNLIDPTAPIEDDSEVTEHEAGTQEPVTV